jgi:hypothetical protein
MRAPPAGWREDIIINDYYLMKIETHTYVMPFQKKSVVVRPPTNGENEAIAHA